MQAIFSPLIKIYKALYLFAYDITGNYGFALVLLSLFSFVVLYPFNKKAQQIQNKEYKIQAVMVPQIETIKKHYSGQEQYEQLQWLYQRYGYHPLYAIRSALGFVLQIPFLTAAYYMLSGLSEIRGVSWRYIPDLGSPDHLLGGINLLPFIMTAVTVVYAFLMPDINKKERLQTIGIGLFFLILLYSAPSALLIFWTCNLVWSLLDSVLNKRLGWLGDYFSENEAAFHIIFALSLTAGLLVPLEVYIKNVSQLWFSIKETLKYLLADTSKCFVILLAVYNFCWHKKNKGIYLSVLLGLLFGVFLQSYVIGIDYGLFDGHEIAWKKYTKEGLLNTFIWLFCFGETFVVFKRFKFDLEKIKKYVKPVSFGIVVIQCIALMFALKNNPLPDNAFRSKDSINVLTTKDMFTISSKDNIIVFLLDAFDARIFEEIMIKDPEIIKELAGFTFYPDTVSVYGITDYSLPQILTGKVYLNERPYAEYFEEAWKETPYYNALLSKNYDICIYTAGNLVSKIAPISNLISEKTVLNDESMRSFNNLVRFRMAPHYVKKTFYDYDPNVWMRLLANSNVQAYQENDRVFYDTLKKGLTYQDDKNCFRFYHLAGVHFPFFLDRNLEPLGEKAKGSQYEQSVGVMKIVLEYMHQMKNKGIFDNSIFVIMADHGDHNKIGSRALLCIKQPNETSAIKISNEPISFSGFMPMILHQFLGNERYVDFTVKNRNYYYVMKNNDLIEYQVLGSAKNLSSWKKGKLLENYYHSKNDTSYELNKEIDFSIQGNSSKFEVTGWDRKEALGTWALGTGADLQFKLNNFRNQNLKLSLIASSYVADLPLKTVKILVNNYYIGQMSFTSEDKIAGENWTPSTIFTYKIPSYVIIDNVLNIHFHIDQPGVSVKYEYGRDLGLFLNRLKIEVDN